MRGRTAAVLAALPLLVGGVVAPVAARAAASGGGVSAAADRGTVAPGDRFEVIGAGWPADGRVQVSLCGNNALAGTADCDLRGSVTVAVSRRGTFETDLVAAVPPKPCPCVLFVTSPDGRDVVRFPIEVVGLTNAVPRGPETGSDLIDVVRARVTGAGPWTAWFGARPRRHLVLEIENTSSIPLTPTLTVLWGGANPTHPVEVPDIAEIAPGERTTVEVPVTLDWLSWGSYEIGGEVIAAGSVAEFHTTTSATPWGAVALGVGLVLLVVAHLVRSRRRRRDAAPPGPTSAEPLALPPAPALDDAFIAEPAIDDAADDVDVIDATDDTLVVAAVGPVDMVDASRALLDSASTTITALIEDAREEAAAIIEQATGTADAIRDHAAEQAAIALIAAEIHADALLRRAAQTAERAELESLVLVERATDEATRLTDDAVALAARLVAAATNVRRRPEPGQVIDLSDAAAPTVANGTNGNGAILSDVR